MAEKITTVNSKFIKIIEELEIIQKLNEHLTTFFDLVGTKVINHPELCPQIKFETDRTKALFDSHKTQFDTFMEELDGDKMIKNIRKSECENPDKKADYHRNKISHLTQQF